MPSGVRQRVEELWVHRGSFPAGGGNESILIHTTYALTVWTFIEEIFLHEAAHTTLDYGWGGLVSKSAWQAAQQADGRFISDYAKGFPDREDLAESYGAFAAWQAWRVSGRLKEHARVIETTIPHRLELFRALGPEFAFLSDDCSSLQTYPVTNLVARTRGSHTTITWTPPGMPDGVSGYQWRVGTSPTQMSTWKDFGGATTTRLRVRNYGRGNTWFLEVRALWGEIPGPSAQVRFVS
jgi:hypothetical protein